MYRSLLMKFVLIIIATCLLIFVEYKFEVIDYLRFVNSAKSIQGGSIAYSWDGEMIAVGKRSTSSQTSKNKKPSKEVQIEIRRVKDNSLVTSINSSTTGNLTFSPDNSLIAAGSYDGKVYVWRVSDGELLYSYDLNLDPRVSNMGFVSFSQDGQNIVTLASGLLNVRNLASQTNRVVSGDFVSAVLSPNRETVAIGNRNNRTVDLYKLDDLSLVKQLEVHRRLFSLKFSSDGKKIAFIASSPPDPNKSYSKSIYIYSIEDGSLLNIFTHPFDFPWQEEESLENFAISPDRRYLAASYHRSVSSDFFVGAPKWSDARYYGRIRVWRIEDGKQLPTFRGHKRRTSRLVFSPDSKFIASTGADGKVRFWKMPPRNYSRFWIFSGICFAALVYWQRTSLINWISR